MGITQNERGFHTLPLLLLLIVLGVIVFAGMKVFKKDNNNGSSGDKSGGSGSSSLFAGQYQGVCKDRDVSFTSAPMKMNQLGFIRPLGAMSDGHVTPTDHVYVGPTNTNVADNTYPVLTPANGTVVEIAKMPAQYIGDRKDVQVAPEDHRLVISHSCRYFSIYIHVHKLSDALAQAASGLEDGQSKQVNVELKAGDTVGYIGGSTFDWTPVDTSKQLKGFITPDFYKGESWKIHTVSPFDLYSSSLKEQLEAKSLRSVAPLGGKIDYDKPGKLIGNWFLEGSGGYTGKENAGGRYWNGHLSVVPDYIDPSTTIVSTGDWKGSAHQYAVKGSVDPANVSAGDAAVKYELMTVSHSSASNPAWRGDSLARDLKVRQDGTTVGTIMLQVLDDEKLKVETFPGKTASQVSGFTSSAKTYER